MQMPVSNNFNPTFKNITDITTVVGSIGKLKFNPKDNCVWDIKLLEDDLYMGTVDKYTIYKNQIQFVNDDGTHFLDCDGLNVQVTYSYELN
jgi:hypothetical protein